jgi:hypothetical protein
MGTTTTGSTLAATAGTALAAAARSTLPTTGTALPTAAGTTLAALRGTRVFEGLHLVGAEDPGELVLHFFFEIGDLLALVFGKVELLFGEARDEVRATTTGAALTTATAAGSSATATTTWSTCAAAVLPGAGTFGVVSGHRSASQHGPGQGERQRQFHEAVHRGLLLPP